MLIPYISQAPIRDLPVADTLLLLFGAGPVERTGRQDMHDSSDVDFLIRYARSL